MWRIWIALAVVSLVQSSRDEESAEEVKMAPNRKTPTRTFATCAEQWAKHEQNLNGDLASLLQGMQHVRRAWALLEQAETFGYHKLFAGTLRNDQRGADHMAQGMSQASALLQKVDEVGERYRDRIQEKLSPEQKAEFDKKCHQTSPSATHSSLMSVHANISKQLTKSSQRPLRVHRQRHAHTAAMDPRDQRITELETLLKVIGVDPKHLSLTSVNSAASNANRLAAAVDGVGSGGLSSAMTSMNTMAASQQQQQSPLSEEMPRRRSGMQQPMAMGAGSALPSSRSYQPIPEAMSQQDQTRWPDSANMPMSKQLGDEETPTEKLENRNITGQPLYDPKVQLMAQLQQLKQQNDATVAATQRLHEQNKVTEGEIAAIKGRAWGAI